MQGERLSGFAVFVEFVGVVTILIAALVGAWTLLAWAVELGRSIL